MDIRFLLGRKVVVRGDAQLNNEMVFGLFKRFTFPAAAASGSERRCQFSLCPARTGCALGAQRTASGIRRIFSDL